tara:strand:+ start:130 stop:954 length:825 start_codon:yes stop_codon:yes gene_type:complete
MKRNIFTVALEEKPKAILGTLWQSGDPKIISLLNLCTAVEADNFSFKDGLFSSREELASYSDSVDTIVAQWDFPISALVPTPSKEHEITSSSVTSALKCEHKRWSRIEQSQVISEAVPRYYGVEPFADLPFERVTLSYPFRINPVKALSPYHDFKNENFDPAINEAIINTNQLGAPQETMFQGELNVSGITSQPKSYIPNTLFDRLAYSSNYPAHDHHKMVEVLRKFLEHIGYDNACFNVKSMWSEADANQDQVEEQFQNCLKALKFDIEHLDE